MQLIGLSEKVFLDRYAAKNPDGSPMEKTPEEMWKRVSTAVASIEKTPELRKKYEALFFDAMTDFKFIPGGRILAGAGTGYAVTFYNCFVIPSPRDSRGGIIDSLKEMVEIMSRGGGVGINLSSLRPRGFRVKKVNGFSSGPINWAELFSVATKDIIQQGGSRRGALMEMLWDWHPDIEEFITVKQNLAKLNGANLSVCISDDFMEAVEKDLEWDLIFPDVDDPDYDVMWGGDIKAWKARGKKVIVHKTIKARYIWDKIAEAAWKSAEPGVVFMERCQKYYNNWYWNQVNCVNPCGEEPLPPYGVCNLGSINLSALVRSESIDDVGVFDWQTLRKIVSTGVRFLDNVVDMDPYVFPTIKITQLEGERRIGLGTMGLGDALIKMHLRYGSPESLEFIDKLYREIRDVAYTTGVEIAIEKGAFPKFDKEKYPQGLFIKQLPEKLQQLITENGIRNSLTLMQAPTGSTSLMANTTSGIEPVFEFEFVRKDRIGEHIVQHYLYAQWQQAHAGEDVQKPDWFASASDLTPEDHVKVQSVIQKYVDASISKTVNAPPNHTVEDVKKLYTMAYKLGLKGITYMREGSRQGVLERVKEEPKKEIQRKKRNVVMKGFTYKTETPTGDAYITINNDENDNPYEIFVNVGKPGYDISALADALGRMLSLVLRLEDSTTPRDRVRHLVSQLNGIGGSKSIGFGPNRVRSLPDAIAKVLADHFGFKVNGGVVDTVKLASPEKHDLSTSKNKDICPQCGDMSFVREEGCSKCYSCGYAAC